MTPRTWEATSLRDLVGVGFRDGLQCYGKQSVNRHHRVDSREMQRPKSLWAFGYDPESHPRRQFLLRRDQQVDANRRQERLQYRILRAFKKAGINGERASGALVHGLRHTFATELANANVSVYTLMKLMGHESMVTSQRYVDGAETRSAAELNPLY